jgi:hypothetical protein
MNRFEFLLSWTIIPITIVLGLFCQKIVSFAALLGVNLHFMKVSTENDNNFGYETINNMWFLGKRESVNSWKKADFDGFREKDE